MADVQYRINLKASSFPFLSENFGRSVIVRQQDNNYVSGLAAKESLDSSVGVPQVYYCHNVVATDVGYKSVGYDTYTAAPFPAGTGIDKVVTIRDGSGNSALFTVSALGTVYVMPAGSSAWTIPTTPPAPATIAGKRFTIATVSGVTYIYFSTVGCYTYDWGTGAMSSVTLTGLVTANILGVVGNRGYLIAYSTDSVAWSSTTDPTDFTPSLETGAGGGQIEGARGAIVTIESVYGGMIAFTDTNAVSATASDNVRYPYSFNEITGAGGLTDPDYVSYDANSASVYAYTTAGLQAVNLRQAQAVFPEVTDFLSGGKLEYFDEVTNEMTEIDVSGVVLLKRLAVVASRYLIISYGNGELTDAIYYDIGYKQFGKLRITHADCFEFERSTVEIPKKSIAFLTENGAIYILNSDIGATNSNGVLVLGKYQYVRTRVLQLQGVELENVNAGATFSLYDLPSFDGKNYETPVEGYLNASSGKFRGYLFHTTALNHSLLCKGNFHLHSGVLTFNVGGGR